MKVNLNGERFCNESGPYDYMLHSTIMQPHQTYVDIWDANHAAQAEAAALLAADPLLEAPEHSLLAAQVEQMFTKAGAMN